MRLITDKHLEVLLENGRKAARNLEFDPYPVVKLFTPDANATWLIAEADPEDPDILYGLCDLGLGFAEPGSVRLSEILEVRGALGLPVERDVYFAADRPLSEYARLAAATGAIIL